MEVVFDDEKVKALFTNFNLMIREKGSHITRAVKSALISLRQRKHLQTTY